MASWFSLMKSLRASYQSSLISGMVATRGTDGPGSEGLVLVAATTESTKRPDSLSESSTTTFRGAFGPCSSKALMVISLAFAEATAGTFFTIVATP